MRNVLTPKKILVIRLSSLGDVVLALPTLSALKAAWPKAHLTLLVKKSFAPLFVGHPLIDEIAVFESRGVCGWMRDIRQQRYGLVVDLHDTLRSRLWSLTSGADRCVRYDKRAWERRLLVWFKKPSHQLDGGVVERYLESLAPLGVSATDTVPRLYVPPGERLPEEIERRVGPGPFIGVAPGALHATKRWPPDRFAQAADLLHRELNLPVVLMGSKSDIPAVENVLRTLEAPAINVAGQTSVRDLMIVLSRCKVVLTNDSGALHVSAALGVPTVAIFGPTVKPFGFFPKGHWTTVVESEGLDCRPCSLHGSKICPKGHFRCMNDVTMDRVVNAARDLLNRPSQGPA
ncbi:MAG: glycosyltransferase family 9 protein [Elusimicrobia bacterium]|nr:glycosyltransferase family 9 protein [Elusimicrobiota bacterium]